MWDIDPTGSALRLGLFAPLSSDERAGIEKFATERSLRIAVYTDETASRPEFKSRRVDATPFAGGFRYTALYTNAQPPPYRQFECTGGFGYSISGTQYMLTAGHCFPRTTTYQYMWNTEDGPDVPSCCTGKNYIGHQSNSTFQSGTGTVPAGGDNLYHGDLSLVNLSIAGKTAGDHIWWGPPANSATIPVSSTSTPFVGQHVCTSGTVTGSKCGLVVLNTNTSFMGSPSETIINGDVATSTNEICARGGDSGGPVVVDHNVGGDETFAVAVGIMSAANNGSGGDGCNLDFTGIDEAIQAWGGGVKLH
jgi:hypothetical protein